MKIKAFIFLSLIVIVGIFFRFYDINWDQNFHLHPDERFLTMIGVKETLPQSFIQYLTPQTSPLNPSVLGFSFYVYGTFPLTLNFLLALLFHTQTYDLYAIQGRLLSAFFDVFTLLIVFAISSLLEKTFNLSQKTKFFAAFFYAIAVLPIQLSHFFTVDIFLSFFMTCSLFFSLEFALYRKVTPLLLASLTLGLGVACKLSGLAVVPLEIFLFAVPVIQKRESVPDYLIHLLLYVLGIYLVVRLADPYLFQSSSFLNPWINQTFLGSIQTLSKYSDPNVWYPPSVQWVNKLPVVFSLTNIIFYGLGVGPFIFCVLGIVVALKTKKIVLISLVFWTVLFFLFQSVQFVKTMRYFIFLYPLFAVFAGIGFSLFVRRVKSKPIILFSILLIVLWPLAFFSIYTKPHTRVLATNWIYSHIPPNSVILGEYWDDPLPLNNGINGKTYNIDLVHVFDTDTKEKWTIMNKQLQNADYLILSSNRGWGSIPSDRKVYPIMGKWYADLFANKLNYRKIAEFTSFPSLTYLGIPLTIPDTMSEEAFTVYDHPEVMIFKNISKK